MRKIARWLLIYILSIFAFGVLYFFWWSYHLDSFVISDQFNLHPLSSDKEALANMVDVVEFSHKSDSLKHELAGIKSNYTLLERMALFNR